MIGGSRYTTSVQVAQQTSLSNEIAKLQTQISTEKRLTTASDDPAAAARIAQIRRAEANDAVYAKNADTGTSIANAVDTQLSTVASALDRANEILITARSDTSSASDRASLAAELRGIAQDVDSYANATDPTGNPLFPDGTPLALPVSDTLSVSATDAKSNVFNVTTRGSTMSISDFLDAAASRLEAAGSDGSAVSDDVSTMSGILDHISSVRTAQGIREQRFSAASDLLANTDTDLKAERSTLEDTDLTCAATDLQFKQTALQAAQTTYASIHKSTLFDLLG